MKVNSKKWLTALLLMGGVASANADICTIVPGNVVCGPGTVNSLNGNGMVTVNGTTVLGATHVNGLLNAEDANFSYLNINGSAKLVQCTVNDQASIKGHLSSSSSKFEKSLEVFSSETRFINSKIGQNLRVGHTESRKQVVFLDNFSEVTGDVIFDDGEGEVILRGQSKIGGKVIGGNTTFK